MRSFTFFLAAFLLLAAALVPAALWIYQGFQFGDWNWNPGRIATSHLQATVAKALFLSAALSTFITWRCHARSGHL